MKKNQKQQPFQDRNQRNNSDTNPVFQGERETEEIVPGVPIIRSNTPHPSSFDAMLPSTGYSQKSQHRNSFEMGMSGIEKGEVPRDFPSKAPSAPPLPEELEGDVDRGQHQILGLSFADIPSWTGSVETGQVQGTVPRAGQTALLSNQRWLIAFSLYLVGLVLLLLLLAVVQGMGVGRDVWANGFTPLGVPWQVLIYGLLSGCISCIISLSHMRISDPPLFVMITWFTRPFVGSILALFSYILLTSGLFTFAANIDRHPGFFWLVGILAGLCEWWLFSRRREPSL